METFQILGWGNVQNFVACAFGWVFSSIKFKDGSRKNQGLFYRGTEWIALSYSKEKIHKGKSVMIKELDRIKLIVGE